MNGFYSMREAAKLLGISRYTLRRWLAEAGVQLPEFSRGSKFLLSIADLDRVLALRRPLRRSA